MDMELDRIARDAARLLHDGSETTVQAAICGPLRRRGGDAAAAFRGGSGTSAMQQQSMGAASWRVRHSVEAVEECMAGLHWAVEDLELRLAGRAAEGVVDGLEPVWMRVHSTVDDGVLCSVLEEQEFEVTGIGTLETRHGRMTRITAEAAEFDLVLLRCHHRSQVLEAVNLVTGGPVSLVELESFGRRIDRGLSDAGRDPSGETG